MKKVNQQEVDKGTGDCMRACIASVLEIDIQAVPHLTRTPKEKWFSVMYYFFIAYGWKYAGMWHPVKRRGYPRKPDKSSSFDGFYLASVNSLTYEKSQGITHMVIVDRNLHVVHDPAKNKLWQDADPMKTNDLLNVYEFKKMNKTDKEYWSYVE